MAARALAMSSALSQYPWRWRVAGNSGSAPSTRRWQRRRASFRGRQPSWRGARGQRQSYQRPPGQLDAPGSRRGRAGRHRGAREGGSAGAVAWPINRPALAGLQPPVQRIEQRCVPSADASAPGCLQQGARRSASLAHLAHSATKRRHANHSGGSRPPASRDRCGHVRARTTSAVVGSDAARPGCGAGSSIARQVVKAPRQSGPARMEPSDQSDFNRSGISHRASGQGGGGEEQHLAQWQHTRCVGHVHKASIDGARSCSQRRRPCQQQHAQGQMAGADIANQPEHHRPQPPSWRQLQQQADQRRAGGCIKSRSAAARWRPAAALPVAPGQAQQLLTPPPRPRVRRRPPTTAPGPAAGPARRRPTAAPPDTPVNIRAGQRLRSSACISTPDSASAALVPGHHGGQPSQRP